MNVNLVKNGTFEVVNEGWSIYCSTGANSCDYSTNNQHSGSKCMHLASTAAGWSSIHQVVGLTAGKTYTLTMYAKRVGIDVWVAYRDNGVMHHCPSLWNSIGPNYSRIEQQFTVEGSGTKLVDLYIIAGSLIGDAWIDDVELLEDVNDEISSNYPDSIINGSFDEESIIWEFDTGVGIVSGASHSGNKHLLFSGSSNYLGAARQWIELIPGNDYLLTYYAKRLGSVGMLPSIQYTKSDGSSGYIYPSSVNYDIRYFYSQHQYAFSLPSTARSGLVRIALNCYCSSGTNSILEVDDVKLCGPKLRSANITAAQTQVWSQPSGTGNVVHRFRNGTPVTVLEIDGNTICYKTFVGQRPAYDAYVRKEYVGGIGDKNAATRIAEIAEFYVGISKSDPAINLSNEWCQSFANMCVGQAGLISENPWVGYSNCADVWNQITKVTNPVKGALVFTKNANEDTVSHVAVIVSDVSNGEFTVVEGDYNGSNTVTTRDMSLTNPTTVGYGLPNGVKS